MIFIDECDALFGKRGDGERSFVTSIKSQFLVEMTSKKLKVSMECEVYLYSIFHSGFMGF